MATAYPTYFHRCEECRATLQDFYFTNDQFRFCSFQCLNDWKAHRARGFTPPPRALRLCRLPGCQRPCYIEGSRVHDCCGRSHAQQHLNSHTYSLPGSVKPYYDERSRTHDYGYRFHSRIPQPGVWIVNLRAGSRQYERVKSSFRETWCCEKGHLPRICQILEVVNPKLEERLKTYIGNLPPRYTHTEEFYHGTSFKCTMPRNDPCSDSACGACGISKKGFDPDRISSRAWQRFGKGFYFAVNSSKAYDYPISLYRLKKQPRQRCLLVCEIAPGRKHYVYQDEPSLRGPPRDCHSVYGKANPSPNGLNYEEIVVYETEAIRPRYILILENTFVQS